MSDDSRGRQERLDRLRSRVDAFTDHVGEYVGGDEDQFQPSDPVKLAISAGVGAASMAVAGVPEVAVARAAYAYGLFDFSVESARATNRKRERAEGLRERERRGESVDWSRSSDQGVVERVVDGLRGVDGEANFRNQLYAKMALGGAATAAAAGAAATGAAPVDVPIGAIGGAAAVGWTAGGLLDDTRRAGRTIKARFGGGGGDDRSETVGPDRRGEKQAREQTAERAEANEAADVGAPTDDGLECDDSFDYLPRPDDEPPNGPVEEGVDPDDDGVDPDDDGAWSQ